MAIYTDALMKALIGGASGYTYLTRVLTVLLQTLLQDNVAGDLEDVNTKLSDIAVTGYTASELMRLCLLPEEYDDDEEDDEEGDVPTEHLEALASGEFYSLKLEAKLSLLRGLCSRVLETDSLQDYMEEQQKTAVKIWK